MHRQPRADRLPIPETLIFQGLAGFVPKMLFFGTVASGGCTSMYLHIEIINSCRLSNSCGQISSGCALPRLRNVRVRVRVVRPGAAMGSRLQCDDRGAGFFRPSRVGVQVRPCPAVRLDGVTLSGVGAVRIGAVWLQRSGVLVWVPDGVQRGRPWIAPRPAISLYRPESGTR